MTKTSFRALRSFGYCLDGGLTILRKRIPTRFLGYEKVQTSQPWTFRQVVQEISATTSTPLSGHYTYARRNSASGDG